MHKVRVLIVSSPVLSRLIQQLLDDDPAFEVVGSVAELRKLRPEAERLLPELIVASVKPVTTGVCSAVLFIKQASPSSKLLLICPTKDFIDSAFRGGADGYIQQEELVRRLLPAASGLSEMPTPG